MKQRYNHDVTINMSVADILRKNGEWMKRKDLLKAVLKEFRVSERQSYRDIKKSIDLGEIRKIVNPDRSTVYGLPNWPLIPVHGEKLGADLTGGFQGRSKRWEQIQKHLEKESFSLEEITLHKNVDSSIQEVLSFRYDTKYRVNGRYKHFNKYTISGIVILKDDVEAIKVLSNHLILFDDNYDALLLVVDKANILGDNLSWNDKVYAISQINDRYDKYDFVCIIANVTELNVDFG